MKSGFDVHYFINYQTGNNVGENGNLVASDELVSTLDDFGLSSSGP